MFLKILNPERRKLLSALKFTSGLDLYLAGETALALYLGHRTSIDFDFYRPKEFKKEFLTEAFRENLVSEQWEIFRDEDNTFELMIENIHLSCFFYRYPLLRPFRFVEGVQLASLEDIAAMKIVAIGQRGKHRDFIDIYYLIRKMGLSKLLRLTQQKYKEYNPYIYLRGLLYFTDAEKDKAKTRIEIFDKSLTWPVVKKYIITEVIKYQKSWLKRK